MDELFVCLANSYKHGGRCIAGIEVAETSEGYRVITDHGRPKWIRPVCRHTDAGAIPNEIAARLDLLAIVRMTNVEACPQGAQSENAYFDELIPVGASFDARNIEEHLSDNSRQELFYNYGKAVVPDVYNRLGDHSILLIEATDAEIYGDTTYTEYPRYRVRFLYCGHQYDLPITDPWYIQDLKCGKRSIGKHGTLYITCSLGVEHEGWHNKLAACIIEPTSPADAQPKAYSVDEVRKIYPQAYAKWTPEDDDELGRLYDQGWTVSQLMDHFQRNEGSIQARLKKIGKIV